MAEAEYCFDGEHKADVDGGEKEVRKAALRKDIRGVLTTKLDYSYPNLIRLS